MLQNRTIGQRDNNLRRERERKKTEVRGERNVDVRTFDGDWSARGVEVDGEPWEVQFCHYLPGAIK